MRASGAGARGNSAATPEGGLETRRGGEGVLPNREGGVLSRSGGPVTVTRRGELVLLRLHHPRVSTRVHIRAVAVSVALLGMTAVVFAWSLSVGDFPVPLPEVVATLLGRGSEDSDFIVGELRLPRGLTGLLVGAAFGMAGAIVQRLARNPLASPDIIGINAGAAAAGVFVIVVLGHTGVEVTAGALGGALLAGAAIYLFAYRKGVTGYRLVLVGVGVSAVLMAVTEYLLTLATIEDAQRSILWLTGSLNGRDWAHVRPVSVALAVLMPLAVALSRQLRTLELGDDIARALGVRIEVTKACLVVVGVSLAAVATASAGPIGFVALVSPQVARLLVGTRSAGLLPAAACGSLLVLAADLVARRLFAPTELPVGIATAAVGAPYLLWLLARANRVSDV